MAKLKEITFEEFKGAHNKSGESLMDIAIIAQFVTDDQELADSAKAIIKAEDEFFELFQRRGMEMG